MLTMTLCPSCKELEEDCLCEDTEPQPRTKGKEGRRLGSKTDLFRYTQQSSNGAKKRLRPDKE